MIQSKKNIVFFIDLIGDTKLAFIY
jgi:hypothetical protein